MKKVYFILFLIIFILSGCKKEENKKGITIKKPISVQVQKVIRGVFCDSLSYKGTVLPWKKAAIGPDASGRIFKIYKKQGDMVKKGELIAELDTTTLKLQLNQAEAGLAVANASYKDAKLNYKRMKALYEKEAISKMQFEKAELNLESADTQRKSAEATKNMLKHTLSKSYMRAPFNGIITSKNMEEEDMINPNMGRSSGVLTLMDLKKVKISLNIASEDIEKIKIGQHCKINVSSLQDEVFEGEVYSKNLAADPRSKTFKVEVKVKNPEIKIKAGVFADVQIEIFRKENILLVPVSAILYENNESYVVLFNNGKAKMKNVKTGVSNESIVEITEGLSEGQVVVYNGNYDLKEGALIKIEGETK
jgi:RND family efflux transporter MFP subunit